MRGASLEVLSDLLGSIGVLVAGVVLLTTDWAYVDPIVGVAIGLLIPPRARRLGREGLRVLLQIAPSEIDVPDVRRLLDAVPGVARVHDLHVWTLTSGLRVASGHLDLAPGSDSGEVHETARRVLGDDLGIEHVTLQVEPPGFREEQVPV